MDYVYIISNNQDAIKVGISKNPEKRLKQLQTSNPNRLSLIYKEEFICERKHLLKIEKLIHRALTNSTFLRGRVGEWFKLDLNKIEDIKKIVIWNRMRFENDISFFKN